MAKTDICSNPSDAQYEPPIPFDCRLPDSGADIGIVVVVGVLLVLLGIAVWFVARGIGHRRAARAAGRL